MLKDEFPAVADRIRLRTPDEKDKRHGQAIAAASLPVAAGPVNKQRKEIVKKSRPLRGRR